MDKTVNDAHVVTALKRQVKATSYRKTASELGVSFGYVQDVVKGRRRLTDRIAIALGYDLVPVETVKTPARRWTKKDQ
jgi:plasmid maintenance system antidote protein VapI